MTGILDQILNWSEVWAIFIPLLVLIFRREQPAFLKPVIIYLWFALVINLVGDTIGDFKAYLPGWLHSNNILYNIHSLVRFACFSFFFQMLGKEFRNRFDRIVNLVALLFIILNFTLIEKFNNPNHLSGNLLSTEAYVLLIYCMQYYLLQLKADAGKFAERKDFWVVTGLSIYVVINFFVFLFYVPMLKENPVLADEIWTVHNLAYITLCIFITRAFYVSD